MERNGGRLSRQEVAQRLKAMQCVNEADYAKFSDRCIFRCILCDAQFATSLTRLFASRNFSEREPACAKCFKKCRDSNRNSARLKRLEEQARIRGGEVISKSLPRNSYKVFMRCSEGHEWSVSAQSILQGSWCPRCSHNFPRSLNELNEIVVTRGGRLISSEYKGVDATYVMECSLGHQFRNMFKKIESGQWCPICSKGKISEEIARTTFEQIFRVRFYKDRPQWLRNSRGRQMELDGANLEIGVAFEYQGVQHFEIGNQYVKTEAELNQRRLDDEKKMELCLQNGMHLVVLTNSMERKDFPKEIQRQLENSGFDIPSYDFDTEIDMAKAYVRQDRLIELRVLLSTKSITVLSNAWMGVNAKYELRCEICKTEWEAKGNAFFNSRQVAGCNVCANVANHENLKLGIDALTEFASRFNGQLLSDTYVQRLWTYKWRCINGHKFEANFNNMVFRNQFCPECEKRPTKTKGTLQILQNFAEQHNGELLSKEFLKTSSKYSWKCSKGHEFDRTYDHMLQAAHFCAECGKDVPRFEKKKHERFLELNQFAAQHGGCVVETEYHGRDFKYSWTCVQGHEFIRNYSDMKFRNRFCWFCDGTK